MPRYAAVDIGSNSVRMQAAEVTPGSPVKILAAGREVTRLGESVFRTGQISPEAMDLLCQVLTRMSSQYKNLDVVGVRAVATSAVRDAGNSDEFLVRASHAVGAPVEIISGQEEARLIFLGVQSRWPHPKQKLLIVDVGGGSAEIILSEHGRMTEAVSKQLGAVRLTEVFLKNDPPRPHELQRMEKYIEQRIVSVVHRIGRKRLDRMIATSATASALVCAINRVPRARRDEADRIRASAPQVARLYQELCRRDLAGRRKVTGIGPRRAEIIIAGAAVLVRVLQDLRLPSVYYSAAGVRDGIIADLASRGVGRELSQLNRGQRRTVEAMATHYGMALTHARKVAELANTLFTSLQPLHRLAPNFGRLLEASAYLHDVGHYVSDTKHHRHSYYLVANSDMPGFTDHERELVANLCRYHRKAMPTTDHSNLQPLTAEETRAVRLLTPLLRVADNLDRSHEQRIKSLQCRIRNEDVVLEVSSGGDIDLEQWAAERAGEAFRQVYERPLSLVKARS